MNPDRRSKRMKKQTRKVRGLKARTGTKAGALINNHNQRPRRR
jgi:hypothetical protein